MTSRHDSKAACVKAFLLRPRDRTAFNAFFDYTFRKALAYLRYLRSVGFHLPVDDRTDNDPLHDLSIDLLGPILESPTGRPYCRIFDFYKAQGINDFENQEADHLADLYLQFLRRQLRQESSRLRKQADPQLENLKRRIRDIVKLEPCALTNGRVVRVSLVQYGDDIRADLPEISTSELIRLAHETYATSRTRAEWCHQILAAIASTPNCCRRVSLHRLTSAMVRTNAEHIETADPLISRLPGPSRGPIRAAADEACRIALDRVRDEVLSDFAAKGRLKPAEVDCLAQSCRLYLNDFSNNGYDTESIPTFFKATMPSETHDRYLTDYKYILDKAIAHCLKVFAKTMKKNPMVRAYGFYDTDE